MLCIACLKLHDKEKDAVLCIACLKLHDTGKGRCVMYSVSKT